MTKILVAYFSLTGHTRQVAEAIAEKAAASLDPVVDTAGRTFEPSHMLWFAMEAIFHRLPEINPPKFEPADFDLVVIGTPVWAGRVAPPILSYINRHRGQFKQLALFCTEGGMNGEHALNEAATVAGLRPKARLIVTEPELASGAYRGKVEAFLSSLQE